MGIISTHQIQNLREDDVRDFLCVHVCKYKILNLRNLNTKYESKYKI
jgi:hypothetical protein